MLWVDPGPMSVSIPYCEVLRKGQVRISRNRRACMFRCMNVDKARGVGM